ncbi:MAG TPA: PucR family transcriptional regulator ligand-binding domain-containing protein [Streptosporangiaceae bacterium]|nr:PucR family transcriptional regulator ligand-binding domain-containing protein [Streptosporangiaceae bacterium]
MRVRDLLSVPGLGLRLLTDVAGVDRPIRHVFTTDLPDPSRYLTPGVLVLTGLIWCRGPGDADRFVSALERAGVAALAAGEALGTVPAEVVQACVRHSIPLLAVPAETSFAAVTEEVGRRLSGDRATAMTRVLGRRRLLLSAVAEGVGLDAMFRLMSRELGAECWLLTGLGRVVGGTGPSLPEPLALRLACEYLRADRLPAAAEVTAPGLDAGTYSLLPVGGEPRITSWFLACAGREQDWPHELRETVAELAADVALERARLDAARTGDRKLAEAIVGMLAGGGEGAAPAEIASLMRAAGLPPDGRYVVVALAAEAGRGASPDAGQWGRDLAAELAAPLAEGALAAPLGKEVILLIPVPENAVQENAVPDDNASEDSAPEDTASAAHAFADRIRSVEPVVAADRSRIRITAGVSAPVRGVTALAGALHEAGSARRLAAIRGEAAVSVLTSDEVASHELLLATVPPSVLRSFRARLLGPLLAYDDRHRAELLPTLREFLACSGSWNACAAKMYVHVNTVRYRIRRIEELTGRDLSCLNDQVDFYLALQIR